MTDDTNNPPTLLHRIAFLTMCWLLGAGTCLMGSWQFMDVIFSSSTTADWFMSLIIFAVANSIGIWIIYATARDHI